MSVKFKETEIDVINDDHLLLGTLKKDGITEGWLFNIELTEAESFTESELDAIVKRLRKLNDE